MEQIRRLLFVFIVLISQFGYSLYAQTIEDYNEIGLGSSSLTLARNQVKYTLPSNFVLETMETEYLECLRSKDYTRQLPFAPFFNNKFVSKDGNCIVFIDIVPVASKDSKFIDFPYLQELKLDINTYHISRIMYDFKFNTGKNDISWQELPLHYESSKYANMAFNADTVITYPLTVWKKYKKRYSYCHVVLIQKNGRCPIRLYFLYNNKAKKSLNKYIKSLEGVFRYRDPKDYIQLIEPQQDSIIHIIPRKKKN
ncbi:hypothetical protein NXY21_03630 [Bacteroides thetaiotaomicron]|jgi:hypothetical protein|nr:hypothetical protein [Bacteroides thetaiotaomicron]